MEHQKIIIYWIKQAILKLWQENGTLSMTNETRIMMQEMKLSITQKY